MPPTLDRTWYNTLIDDDGSGLTGSSWDKADVDALMDAVDTAFATLQNAQDWTSYTPTLTNITISNGTVVGRYRQMGKHVEFFVVITLGSGSSMGSDPRVTIPVQMSSTFAVNSSSPIGQAALLDAGVASYMGTCRPVSDTSVRASLLTVSSSVVVPSAIDATTPFAWGSGDVLMIRGSYEAAAAL